MSTLTQRVKQQFSGLDLSFLTDSTMLTIGIALARVLGFGFSFILARRLSTDDFGFIQYSITLAGVVAIGTQPFVQHVLARFVGKHKADEEQLARILHAIWFILLGVTALTMLIGVPLLILTNRFNVGVLVIFVGLTLFYSYYGLARGFMASRRLLAAYLGSNVVQIIAIVLVYQIGTTQSPTPALLIYGLSYLLPLIILQVWQPLPLFFRFKLPEKAITLELLRFSLPVWISHAAYIFYAGMDVLLLERYTDTSVVGVYTLTRTITALFGFVPVGLITILLPKVAALPESEHWALLKKTILVALLANGAALIGLMVCYQWFIGTIFGTDYLMPMNVLLMLALAEILFGFHGIVTAVLVGGNNPQLETVSRVLIVIVAFILGTLLIPRFGMTGAGLTVFGSGIVAMCTYVVAALIMRRQRQKHALSVD